ncbi:MAG: GIY-YIG nuclease family protein [Victivallales bacterium]|nr:GIY-YIG nuclease family protein [Victivallales bacterium]
MARFYYVYMLVDVATGKHHYTGCTENLGARLAKHNSGAGPIPPSLSHGALKQQLHFHPKKRPTHLRPI